MDRTFIIETPEQRDRLLRFLGKIELPIDVVVGKHVSKRSTTQNARLWKLHQLASEQTGYSPQECHDMSLCHVFGYDVKVRTNLLTVQHEEVMIPKRRSKDLTKKEFTVFMERVEQWYAEELGVWLD